MLEEIAHLTIRVLLLCQGMFSPSHSSSLTQGRHASLLKMPLRTEGPSPVSSGENSLWEWGVGLGESCPGLFAYGVREEGKERDRTGK